MSQPIGAAESTCQREGGALGAYESCVNYCQMRIMEFDGSTAAEVNPSLIPYTVSFVAMLDGMGCRW